jgi:hypothetical protein
MIGEKILSYAKPVGEKTPQPAPRPQSAHKQVNTGRFDVVLVDPAREKAPFTGSRA